MSRRALPGAARRGWCPGLARPMPTGDGLLARLHPPLGVLTLAQARAVAEGARRYGNGHLDLTARANLQIRGVSEATQGPLARLLDAAGLGDARIDGGPQRLTLTGPLAGHDSSELCDVAALARAIEAAGYGVAGLPAKTLVAVGMVLEEADLSVVPLAADRVAIVPASGAIPSGECPLAEAPAAVAELLGAFTRTGRRRMREVTGEDWAAVFPTRSAGAFAKVSSEDNQAPFPSSLCGRGWPPSGGRERGATVQDEAPALTTRSFLPETGFPSPDPHLRGGHPPPQRGEGEPRNLIPNVATLLSASQATLPRGGAGQSHMEAVRLRTRPCHPRPHPEVLRSSLEGGLQGSQRDLEPSFEAAAAATAPQDEVAGGRGPPNARALPRGWRDNDRATALPIPGLSARAGLTILALDAPFGRCTVDAFERLIALAESIGAPEIRLTPSRGVVLLPHSPERIDLAALAADFITGAEDPRRAVAACTGAPACASGSTPTLADAARLAEAFRPFAEKGLSAHVSGCAKGCARPGPADLTLVGQDGVYGIVVGGSPGDPASLQIPIEPALERLGRAPTLGLAAAFAPETGDGGRNRRPA